MDSSDQVLIVTVSHMLFSVTEEVFHQVFSPYGIVEKINMCQESDQLRALIQFQSGLSAISARNSLQDRNIYDGCCNLNIQILNATEEESFLQELHKIKQHMDNVYTQLQELRTQMGTFSRTLGTFSSTVGTFPNTLDTLKVQLETSSSLQLQEASMTEEEGNFSGLNDSIRGQSTYDIPNAEMQAENEGNFFGFNGTRGGQSTYKVSIADINREKHVSFFWIGRNMCHSFGNYLLDEMDAIFLGSLFDEELIVTEKSQELLCFSSKTICNMIPVHSHVRDMRIDSQGASSDLHGVGTNGGRIDQHLKTVKRVDVGRKSDVYMGIDVFGRCIYGGEQWNSNMAVLWNDYVSVAIFDPGGFLRPSSHQISRLRVHEKGLKKPYAWMDHLSSNFPT